MYEALKLVGVAWSRIPERSWDPELRYGAQFFQIRLVLNLKENARLSICYKSGKLVAKQMDAVLCYSVTKLQVTCSDFVRKQVR